jgi:hypothetical protein
LLWYLEVADHSVGGSLTTHTRKGEDGAVSADPIAYALQIDALVEHEDDLIGGRLRERGHNFVDLIPADGHKYDVEWDVARHLGGHTGVDPPDHAALDEGHAPLCQRLGSGATGKPCHGMARLRHAAAIDLADDSRSADQYSHLPRSFCAHRC